MFKAMRRKLKTPWRVWCVEICCDILHSPKVHAEDPNFWKAPAGQRFGTIEAPLRWCCAEARAPCLAKNGKCKYGEACKFAASGATTGPDDGKLIGVEGITDADSARTLDGSDVHAQVAIWRKLQCCWSPMFHFWQVLFGSSPCSNRFLAAADKFQMAVAGWQKQLSLKTPFAFVVLQAISFMLWHTECNSHLQAVLESATGGPTIWAEGGLQMWYSWCLFQQAATFAAGAMMWRLVSAQIVQECQPVAAIQWKSCLAFGACIFVQAQHYSRTCMSMSECIHSSILRVHITCAMPCFLPRPNSGL